MIEVKVRYSEKKGFTGIRITGHAQYNPGNDPVCAGVSALGYALFGTLNSIEGLTFIKNEISDHIDIRIKPVFDVGKRHAVNIVFETILIGLRMIQKGYPDNVKIVQ